MTIRLRSAIALLFVLLAPARAQLHPDANDLALSFASDAFIARQDVEASAEFDIYVLFLDAIGGLEETEFAIEGFGASFQVIEEELLSGAQNASTTPYEYVLSLSSCRGESVLPLLRLRIRASSIVEDGLLCLTPPGAEDLGVFPAYRDCNGTLRESLETWPREDPRAPGEFPDGCVVVNPSATTDASSQTIYSLPEILGTPGQTVRMPLTADVQPVAGDDPPADVFAVEGFLRTDPDILSLRGVSLADPSRTGWDVLYEELAPGFWGVYASDPALPAQPESPPLGDLDGAPLLHFDWDVLAPGTVDVIFDLREIVDIFPATDTPCCVVRQVGSIRGAVTQNPVSPAETSFGGLKARIRN